MLTQQLLTALSVSLLIAMVACDPGPSELPSHAPLEGHVLPVADATFRLTAAELNRLYPWFDRENVEALLARYDVAVRQEVLEMFLVPTDPAGPYLDGPPSVPLHSLTPLWDKAWEAYWHGLPSHEVDRLERSVADPRLLVGWSRVRGETPPEGR